MGIQVKNKNTVPVGTIIESACTIIPDDDYYECDGSAKNRITDAILFAKIGTTYGAGDGVTTFNLPDRRANVGRGAGTSVGYAQNVTIVQGAKTDDAFQGHQMDLPNGVPNDITSGPTSGGGITGTVFVQKTGNPISDGTNGTPRTANETRVKSLGMKYFIKKR